MADLESLGLSRRVLTILTNNGIRDIDELTALNERQLLGFSGFGPACLTDLSEALDRGGLALADDQFAPYICVRDGRPGWDVNLADLFLCDECAVKWQAEAFYGDGPEYVGSADQGYCVSCNRSIEIRLRQWLLCGNCDRVARSIGKGVAAQRFLLGQWHELIQPRARHLQLRQIDEPLLRGQQRKNAKGRRN